MAATLTAALDTLLPGNDQFPSAAAIGLDERLSALDHLRPAVDGAVAKLPADFACLSRDDRTQHLQDWEADDPDGFGAFVIAAYSAYYTHPAVLAVVEHATGYAARPPQPQGYALAGFDPAIVAVPKRRGKLWRDA